MQAVSAKTNVPFLHKPRNDMKLGRFCLENGRFLPYAAFLRGAAPHRFSNVSSAFFKRFVPKTVLFSNKTYQICHCEEGACARRGNLKRSKTAFRNETRQSPCNDIQSAAV